MVQVAFLSPCDTNGEESAKNKFFTSCAWQFELTTEVLELFPIRAVPTSWIILPGSAKP